MTKQGDLTPAAQAGYEAPPGAKCPHYDRSPNGMAWLVGQWLKSTGRTSPRGVRMSRGYSLHANDMLVSVKDPKAIERFA
jgi:hypothetical protein